MKYPIGTKLKWKRPKSRPSIIAIEVINHNYETGYYELKMLCKNGAFMYPGRWTDSTIDEEMEPDISHLELYVLNKLKENGYG